MTILLQKGDNNDVGIYCVIKDKGLYGFTLLKNKFFQTYPNILKLNEFNGVETFILDKSQTITHFIEFLDSFLIQNQKSLKNVIDVEMDLQEFIRKQEEKLAKQKQKEEAERGAERRMTIEELKNINNNRHFIKNMIY